MWMGLKQESHMRRIIQSGRPDTWTMPRQSNNGQRIMSHGKILPMEEPGFLERLFGRA